MSTSSLTAKMSTPAASLRWRVNASRPSGRRALHRRHAPFIVFAEPPPQKQKIDLEKAVSDAKEACEDGSAAECATAWDTVEELSAAKAKKKEAKVVDPLEQYCEDEPDADECRVYED